MYQTYMPPMPHNINKYTYIHTYIYIYILYICVCIHLALHYTYYARLYIYIYIYICFQALVAQVTYISSYMSPEKPNPGFWSCCHPRAWCMPQSVAAPSCSLIWGNIGIRTCMWCELYTNLMWSQPDMISAWYDHVDFIGNYTLYLRVSSHGP